jgi:hypothetical protein
VSRACLFGVLAQKPVCRFTSSKSKQTSPNNKLPTHSCRLDTSTTSKDCLITADTRKALSRQRQGRLSVATLSQSFAVEHSTDAFTFALPESQQS